MTVVPQGMQNLVIEFEVQELQATMVDTNFVANIANAPLTLFQKSFDQSQVS